MSVYGNVLPPYIGRSIATVYGELHYLSMYERIFLPVLKVNNIIYKNIIMYHAYVGSLYYTYIVR